MFPLNVCGLRRKKVNFAWKFTSSYGVFCSHAKLASYCIITCLKCFFIIFVLMVLFNTHSYSSKYVDTYHYLYFVMNI